MLWNSACEELTGIPSSEMIGTSDHWKPFYEMKRQTLADIIIDRDFSIVPDLYDKYSRSTLISQGLQAEGWYPNLNGRERYILFDAAPIFNLKGDLTFVIETLQDITAQKGAEEELKKYRNRLEDLVRERTSDLLKANEQLRHEVIERIRAEEELLAAVRRAEDEKARSEAIIAAIGDGITIQDTDFRSLYQNRIHGDLMGSHIGEYCYKAYAKRDRI